MKFKYGKILIDSLSYLLEKDKYNGILSEDIPTPEIKQESIQKNIKVYSFTGNLLYATRRAKIDINTAVNNVKRIENELEEAKLNFQTTIEGIINSAKEVALSINSGIDFPEFELIRTVHSDGSETFSIDKRIVDTNGHIEFKSFEEYDNIPEEAKKILRVINDITL